MELRTNLKRVGSSAVLFFLCTMPFRQIFLLIPVTEIRPASALPPVFGLLFGPWGAIGVAIGNLMADWVSGYSIYVCIMGAMVHFYYGFLTYLLWHNFCHWEAEEPVCFHSVKNVLKYILTVSIVTILVNGMLTLIMEADGLSSAFSLPSVLLFLNNFDFSILLGIPLFVFFIGIGIKPYQPSYRIGTKWRMTIILTGILCIQTGFLFFSWKSRGKMHSEIADFWITWIFLLLPLLVNKIERIERKEQIKNQNKISLKEEVTIRMLLIGSVYLLLMGMFCYLQIYQNYSGDLAGLWNVIYLTVGVASMIVLLFTILFLNFIEKNITIPLEILADSMGQFINNKQKEKPKLLDLKKNNEISDLTMSLEEMMDEIITYIRELSEITAKKEKIEAELKLGRFIQETALPNQSVLSPKRTDFELYALMEPAREVAGDFYDYFFIHPDELIFLIADVSGKGIGAALFMMKAKTIIKNLLMTGFEKEKAVELANQQLCEGNDAGMFVTMLLVWIDFQSHNLYFVNAGHNPPCITNRSGEFEWVNTGSNPVLGLMEETNYHIERRTFDKPFVLFLYTDGVTEAVNMEENFYTEERLLKYLNQNEWEENHAAENITRSVKNELCLFSQEREQADDITIVTFQYKGNG